MRETKQPAVVLWMQMMMVSATIGLQNAGTDLWTKTAMVSVTTGEKRSPQESGAAEHPAARADIAERTDKITGELCAANKR